MCCVPPRFVPLESAVGPRQRTDGRDRRRPLATRHGEPHAAAPQRLLAVRRVHVGASGSSERRPVASVGPSRSVSAKRARPYNLATCTCNVTHLNNVDPALPHLRRIASYTCHAKKAPKATHVVRRYTHNTLHARWPSRSHF